MTGCLAPITGRGDQVICEIHNKDHVRVLQYIIEYHKYKKLNDPINNGSTYLLNYMSISYDDKAKRLMLTQLDDISAFPFKCSHKVYEFVIRDVILYLYFAETNWHELYICAITTQFEWRLTCWSLL